MSQIEFTLPSKDSPGFLRRTRHSLAFAQQLERAKTQAELLAALDQMVEFLLEFVTVPVDRDEARAALEDASQTQLMDLLRHIGGTSPLASQTNSSAP